MPVIATAAAGVIKAGTGYFQKRAANKWLKNNPEQEESMPIEVRQNQEQARIRANTGLPAEQYNNAMKNIQRQQLLALRGASQMGGGKALGILGGINEQGNNAVGDLDARDAAMRVNNEGQLMNVNNNVANWKSKLFDSNVRQKWLRQWQQKMGELGSGNQNFSNGLDEIASAGVGLIGNGSNANNNTGTNTQYPANNSGGRQYGRPNYNNYYNV